MIRKAAAVWRGTGRGGSGDPTSDSGVLSQMRCSFRTPRLGGDEAADSRRASIPPHHMRKHARLAHWATPQWAQTHNNVLVAALRSKLARTAWAVRRRTWAHGVTAAALSCLSC